MEVDYTAPRYTLRQASAAASFPLNTLRSNFQRGWFRSFANRPATGKGHTRRLCLGDVLVLAIADRLTQLRVHPINAWNAAYFFGAVTVQRKGWPRRGQFELFDEELYETVLIWRPESPPEIVPVSKDTRSLDLNSFQLTPAEQDFGVALVLLLLNPVQRTVFKKLRLSQRAGMEE
jgi:hypothetical protein